MSDDEERLVMRWLCTGLLNGVLQSDLVFVAQRLELAHKRCVPFYDRRPLDAELLKLQKEGFFKNGKR